MNILHYTLGLPPYRSGGLTRYALDLMYEQIENGDKVSLLYPGDYKPWVNRKYIKKKRQAEILTYQIVNPSPVPILYGVKDPAAIFNDELRIAETEMLEWYEEVNPEILHVHTFMGFPDELLRFLKGKGVKVIFTTHDYYGLCPKVNFINSRLELCSNPTGLNCSICNYKSPSSKFLRLRNSSYVMRFKKILSKISREGESNRVSFEQEEIVPSPEVINKYDKLLDFYRQQFAMVDLFHFNSSVSANIFQQHSLVTRSKILPVSHKGIIDHRRLRNFNQEQVQVAFIGNRSEYKGFPLLKEALLNIEKDGILNWQLLVWGSGMVAADSDSSRITYKGVYKPSDIERIFRNVDLLVVPSIWKETFSLITLEAISYGVPVLVTSNVGAKDIVKNYNEDFIVAPNNEGLVEVLKSVFRDASILEAYNERIILEKFNCNFKCHVGDIMGLYSNALKGETSNNRN